uniref:Uncharacterized protein n=1 Tax=Timema cristinae TaxID=61476 RepID=A0A7R9HBP9_TIMCR|nr:unnamed protein product [Timema cristinae]
METLSYNYSRPQCRKPTGSETGSEKGLADLQNPTPQDNLQPTQSLSEEESQGHQTEQMRHIVPSARLKDLDDAVKGYFSTSAISILCSRGYGQHPRK